MGEQRTQVRGEDLEAPRVGCGIVSGACPRRDDGQEGGDHRQPATSLTAG